MPSGTADRAGSAGRWLLSRLRTRWVWSPCQESLSHPDPSGTGGEGRMPAVNGVGEPCAGEPHARFEVAGVGNGQSLTTATGVGQPTGKPAAYEGPRPYRR